MIKGIAHVCIAARDLPATERFYRSGLGLGKVFDFIRGGQAIGFYLRASAGTYIEVFQMDEVRADGKCPIQHVCLEVDDIKATVRRLRGQGYDATDEALGADRSWQAWTTDPNGVRIEFHQYTDESCQRTGRDCRLDQPREDRGSQACE